MMKQAAEDKNFELAEKLKDQLTSLKDTKRKLGIYEGKKKAAIASSEFSKAADLKCRIDKIRKRSNKNCSSKVEAALEVVERELQEAVNAEEYERLLSLSLSNYDCFYFSLPCLFPFSSCTNC